MNAFNLVIGDVLTFLTVNIEDSFCNCYYYYLLITPKQFFLQTYRHTKHGKSSEHKKQYIRLSACRFSFHDVSRELVQTSGSGVGWGWDGEIYKGMGMGNFCEAGMRMGNISWGGDSVGMGTILLARDSMSVRHMGGSVENG